MTSTETAQRLPIAPGSIDFNSLPEGIKRDILDAIKRSKEPTLRQSLDAEQAAKKKEPTMTSFSKLFSDTVEQVKLSEPGLDQDQLFERAWTQARFAASAVRLSDPSTTPVPVPPALDELQDSLDRSAADYAIRTSITNAPKPVLPELGHHYKAAIETIAQSSPPLEREAAYKLVKNARAKDLAELNARNAAASNPAPPGGLVGKTL